MSMIISNGEVPTNIYEVGTVYYDQSECMLRVFDGTMWISPTSTSEELNMMDNNAYVYCQNIPECLKSIRKDSDLDELYVEQMVQKAKIDRYLVLDCDKHNANKNTINIKYLEWCRRGNVPYLIAYKRKDGYCIYLELNPRIVYTNRIFIEDIDRKILHISKIHSWFGKKESYLLCGILLENLEEILLNIVDLIKDSDNFTVE